MEALKILSVHNPSIKKAVRLRKSGERRETQLFLVEGYRELTRALEGGFHVEKLYFAPNWFLQNKNEEILLQQAQQQGATLLHCSEAVFAKISYRDRPDGLLGVVRQQQKKISDLPQTANPFFVIAERIEKPGNLGTILRSADAAGVDGVIVSDPCTDIYNPNVVRSSVGCLFTKPVVTATSDELEQFLQQTKITTLAATPAADKVFTQVDLSGPVAILVGAEQYGLKKTTIELATISVKIPMYGIADSLNVAQATTLLLYEVLRQRSTLP